MNTKDLKGNSILLVGANGGLGKEITKALVRDGFKHIVMAGRSESKVIKAREEVLAATKPDTSVKIFAVGGHMTLLQLKKNGLLAAGARIIIAGGEGSRGIPGLIDKPGFSSPAMLRKYVYAEFSGNEIYNPMNAIGVSKLLGAIWISKLAKLETEDFSAIWFSPGLTYGTNGLAGMTPVKRWFMKNVVFGIMGILGQAQSPSQGGRKFADCIKGDIGKNGDLIGAPNGKSIGKLTDQKPMNSAFENQGLREELWSILAELCGPFRS